MRDLAKPRTLFFDLCHICNYHCIFCNRVDKAEFESIEVFEKNSAFFEGLDYIDITGFAEPTLNPDFDAIIEFLTQKNVRFMFNTNGSALSSRRIELLKKSPISMLTVSLNTTKPDRYKKITGGTGNLEAVLRGIRSIGQHSFMLRLSFVMTQMVIDEALDMVKLAKDVGAEAVSFLPMFVGLNYPEGLLLEPTPKNEEGLQQAKKLAGELGIKIDTFSFAKEPSPQTISRCRMPWEQMVISLGGEVRTCCCATMAPLGNINEESLDAIWNGERFWALRDAVQAGDDRFCKHCMRFGAEYVQEIQYGS